MITVSQTATNQLKNLHLIHKCYIRLALRAGGCAGYSYEWSLDQPNLDDSVIGTYLIVDTVTESLLGDVNIDWVENAFSSGWNITSKNLSSCGCGSSVSVGGVHG